MLRDEDVIQPVAAVAIRTDRPLALVALTNDALLIRALQELATGGVHVSVVPDVPNLTDMLLQNAGDTVLIDAGALDSPATEVVDAISRQLPDLRLLVAGHSTDQQQLTSRLASKTVFRFVHKPASTQRLRLILDAACRREAPVAAPPVAAATASAVTRPQAAAGGRIPRPMLATGAALFVALAVAAWLLWPDTSSTPHPSAPPAATAAPAAAQPQATMLLAQADAAYAAGRWVASDGSSAAELYRATLKLESTSQRARDGFDASIDRALHRAEEALLAGRLNEAGTLVAAVALISPDNPRIGFLNIQIAREQSRINSDAAQRQAFEARQATIRAALATMKDRLQRGALLEPAAASAVSSFREAEAIGANEAAVHAGRESLVAALLAAADVELDAGHPPAARRLVDAARSINSSAPGIDVISRRVDEVSAQLSAPEPELPRAEPPAPAVVATPVSPAPAMLAPAAPPPVATAPAPAVPDPAKAVVSARSLKLVRGADPVYPEWALQQLISGWVELEFTVAADGSVKDIKVTNAQPRSTFDSAAIQALSRHRYEPVTRDGVRVPQRANIRLRFTAQDSR